MAKRWVCPGCGYVYDAEKGDPGTEIIPGTSFEQLPADWACPGCGMQKPEFDLIELEEEKPDDKITNYIG